MLLTTKPGLSLRFGLEACPDVYASRIEPGEERLLVSIRAVDEVKRSVEKLLVRGLHALLGEGPESSQLCLPHLPKRGSSPGVSVMVAVHRSTLRGPKRSLTPGLSDKRDAPAHPRH